MSDLITGSGTTIAFQTTGYAPVVLKVDHSGFSRDSHESTPLAPAANSAGGVGNRTYAPDPDVDAGELTITIKNNPTEVAPINAPLEVITVTFPDGATAVFNGFVTSHVPTAYERGSYAEAEVKIKISGEIVFAESV